MTKNFNIKIIDTKEIRPEDVRIELERNMEVFGVNFRNSFEVLEYVNCGNLLGRFLCTYKGKFFTVGIDKVKKLY